MAGSSVGKEPVRAAFRFADLHPVAKLGVWVGAIAVLATLVQGIAWAAGADFNILHASGGGRGVLLAIAVCTLLSLMAADGRPAADYGLVARSRGARLLLGGLALGFLLHAGFWLLLALGGVAVVDTAALSGSRALKATLASITAMPVAMVQQVIFSGYLLGILRKRYSAVVAVLIPAALFAVLRRIDDPRLLFDLSSLPLLVGMFLLAALLGSLRLLTGSIFRPAGLLAGCIFVRRWLRKTAILGASSHPAADWLIPNHDPLQSPLVWLLLACALGVVAYRLYRQGEPQEAVSNDNDSKRLFPFSNSGVLTPLDVWLGRLADAQYRVDAPYLPRLVATLALSTLNTALSAVERLLTPILVWDHRPLHPVIIVGVHRSGTTHLHNLLALDRQFVAPRVHQVLNPAGFLFFSWLMTPLLAAFLPWRRPMDGMRFHVFSPQEDEFALAGLCGVSPHWGMTFPQRWAAYDRYIFPANWSARELRVWQRHLRQFLAKLTFWCGKRPLLKNPYHTARAALLSEMFSQVRFIHVCRNPYDVYRSNLHLAREGHVVNQLQDPNPDDCYQTRFLGNYRDMEEAFYRETAELPPSQVAEVRFEDLERDPIAELKRIYAALELKFTAEYEARLVTYLEAIADYQKNRFQEMPEHERREVESHLDSFFDRWGYAHASEALPRRRAA